MTWQDFIRYGAIVILIGLAALIVYTWVGR
jgi:hypothetical protein